MPDFLTNTVTDKTALPARFRDAAAWQSMQAYLDDWTAARARLDRQIAELTVMVERRKQQVRRGEWPPVDATKPVPGPPAEDHVVDLMAALEETVAAAKEARLRHPTPTPDPTSATRKDQPTQ